MTKENILEALQYIKPMEDYDDWLRIGMALKHEGFDCSVWDNWSKGARNYEEGVCQKKWETFNGSSKPITGATIIEIAKRNGYRYINYDTGGCMDFSDDLSGDDRKELTPVEQFRLYLKTLFYPEDHVGIITEDVFQDPKEKRWKPRKGYYDKTARELLASLDKYPDELADTVYSWKDEAGAWIRINPLDGKDALKENVTRYEYTLIECDEGTMGEQIEAYKRFRLPIAAMVSSAGKSVHAVVKIHAPNYEEYRKRVEFLHRYLLKHDLKIDKANKDPNRMSRLPGATRNGKVQNLLAVNIGEKDWFSWLDFIEDQDAGLPPIENYIKSIETKPIQLPEELIYGVLRQGHKMLIAGPSKAGKSYLLMQLGLCISAGRKWLKFQCRRARVLYLNLEIQEESFRKRLNFLQESLKMTNGEASNFDMWNLRGKALPLNKLVPKLVRRIKGQNYGAIIIDPIYKVIFGDENSASDMGQFCNEFDKIALETGASIIYCHHHSKGAQGQKNMIDRSSGSGVFARDPDAILDIIQLDLDRGFILDNCDNPLATGWQIEGTLREFPPFEPIKCWFDFPLHVVDEKGVLDNKSPKGSLEANLSKSGKRNVDYDKRREEFDKAYELALMGKDYATISEIADALGQSQRTVRNRLEEYQDSYAVEKGEVRKR